MDHCLLCSITYSFPLGQQGGTVRARARTHTHTHTTLPPSPPFPLGLPPGSSPAIHTGPFSHLQVAVRLMWYDSAVRHAAQRLAVSGC